MSVEGIILHHGEAGGVTLHQTRVDYLLTAEHSKQCSLFEFSIAPGFNTGAHYHTKIEELFYVLEGELDLRCGERVVRGEPGTGRTFSMVRRMKAEKTMGIPISLRSGFAISTKSGKAANAMSEDEWAEFYNALSKDLRRDYPDLYERLFSPKS